MGCPALGVWVAFLKQPDALPGRAPQKNNNYIFLNYFWFINDFYFLEFFLNNFLGGASPGSAGCFKKPTQIPNAGHPIICKWLIAWMLDCLDHILIQIHFIQHYFCDLGSHFEDIESVLLIYFSALPRKIWSNWLSCPKLPISGGSQKHGFCFANTIF
jgi:hypothetical protein